MLAATAPTFSSVTTCAPVPMVTTLPRIAPASGHMQPPGESHQSHPRNMEHFNCEEKPFVTYIFPKYCSIFIYSGNIEFTKSQVS